MLSFSVNLKYLANGNRHNSSLYWLHYLKSTSQVSKVFLYVYWTGHKDLVSRTGNVLRPFSIFFLKKEVFYSKLKYSRVPQFDTSSGAAASFTSGLYGFMICEKFGFELLDSGDFLFLLLYLLWGFFIGVTFLQVFNYPTRLGPQIYTLFRSFFKFFH